MKLFILIIAALFSLIASAQTSKEYYKKAEALYDKKEYRKTLAHGYE